MSIDLALLEVHRVALTGHCYRMLGSAVDAEDAVQEAMLRAFRGVEGFDGRASLKTWLYRIATNVCLDALAERSRRERPVDTGPQGTVDDALESRPRHHWLEPIAEARAIPRDADPAELLVLRESTRLAFVAALQYLPPKQRAVLLLTEVLGFSAAQVAELLETSLSSVNSALQRARETLATREIQPLSLPLTEAQQALITRYISAFERYDTAALTTLLHEDATLSMPPYTLWLRGHEAIAAWLLGRGAGCRGSRLIQTRAAGATAFGQYRPRPEGGHSPWALIVLTLSGEKIVEMVSFLDTEKLFPLFDLPGSLAAE